MTVLDELRAQVVLSRAAETARRGNLDSAAAQLVELDEAGAAPPEVLDLLARIRAQQQRWPEADKYWARVQEARPDDPAAATGRKTVAAILAGRRRSRPVLPVVGAVTGIAAVAVLTGGAIQLASDEPTTAEGTPAATAPTTTATTTTGSTPGDPTATGSPTATSGPTATGGPSATGAPVMPGQSATSPAGSAAEERARADRLARQLAAIEAQRRAAAAALNAQLTVLQGKVTGPGLIVQRRPGAIRVLFEQGLFHRDAELTPAGRDSLTALGERLTGIDAAITVTGHSVTVPGSSAGGSSMALLRARIATRELSATSGLPLTTFTLRSADQRESPFPTAARNRTVSLVLIPRS